MKNGFFLLLFLSLQVFAQTAEEEALILRQEMDFLAQSAKKNPQQTKVNSLNTPIASKARQSLEDRFFDETQDTVSTELSAFEKERKAVK